MSPFRKVKILFLIIVHNYNRISKWGRGLISSVGKVWNFLNHQLWAQKPGVAVSSSGVDCNHFITSVFLKRNENNLSVNNLGLGSRLIFLEQLNFILHIPNETNKCSNGQM